MFFLKQRLTFLVALSTCLSACGIFGPSLSPAQIAQADVLWKRLQSLDYRSFSRAPSFETSKVSSVPHEGQPTILVDIYINPVLQSALQSKKPIQSWPVGSLLIKDAFQQGEHQMVILMEKRAEGWLWAQWNAEGSPQVFGQDGECIRCHTKGDDMVLAFRFPQNSP